MEKIYLLPGLMTDEQLWSRVYPLLKEEFGLIHIPIPLCEDFDELCKVLDSYFLEDQINLLGFSFGSYIASYYAIKNPHRVKRLFLLSGSASFLLKSEIEKRKVTLAQMDRFGFKGLSAKKILSLIEKENYGDIDLIDTIGDMFLSLGKDTYKKQMELSFLRRDISEKLCSLNMPIRMFFAKDDKLFDYNALDKISSKKSENIKLSEVEGESHFIPLEKPKELANEIRIWMD